MKLWAGFGSEHSMNLVMIGRFVDASDAAAAKRLIDDLIALVMEEQEAGQQNPERGIHHHAGPRGHQLDQRRYVQCPPEQRHAGDQQRDRAACPRSK